MTFISLFLTDLTVDDAMTSGGGGEGLGNGALFLVVLDALIVTEGGVVLTVVLTDDRGFRVGRPDEGLPGDRVTGVPLDLVFVA